MVKSKNHIFTVVGFFMLAVTLILLRPQRSYAPPPAQSPQPPQDVNVINPEIDPVLTTVENPDFNPVPAFHAPFQPVHGGLTCFMGVNDLSCETSTTVPAGKRLEIELLNVSASIQSGQLPDFQFMTETTSLVTGFPSDRVYFPPAEFIGTFNNFDRYRAMHPVRFYADPGTDITMMYERNVSGDTASGRIDFSGYLVDAPE